MNEHANGTGNGALVAPDGYAAFFPRVEGLRAGQGAEPGIGPGVEPTPDDAERRAAKARIESLAVQAAMAGHTLRESCPWPFGSDEGQHFTAVFLIEGGKLV